jgi:hypothetical protein
MEFEIPIKCVCRYATQFEAQKLFYETRRPSVSVSNFKLDSEDEEFRSRLATTLAKRSTTPKNTYKLYV